MTYDPSVHGLVMFGGRNLTQFFNDTWIFGSTGWRTYGTIPSPSPRSHPALAYDPVDKYTLLYGGGIGNNPAGSGSPWVAYSDTWAFYGHRWHNITGSVAGGPGPRVSGNLAYDGHVTKMLFTSGSNATGGTVGAAQTDSWTYVGGTWTLIHPTGSPSSADMGGAFAWDSGLHLGVVFGNPYALGVSTSSNTWVFTHGSWVNITAKLTTSPPARNTAGMVYDGAASYLLMFGGNSFTSAGYLNDTWAFY